MLRFSLGLLRAQFVLWRTSSSVKVALFVCFLPALLFTLVQSGDGKFGQADFPLFLQDLLVLSLPPLIAGVGTVSEAAVPLEPHQPTTRTFSGVAVPRRVWWAAAHLLVGGVFASLFLTVALLSGLIIGAFHWIDLGWQPLLGLYAFWIWLAWVASFLARATNSGIVSLLILLTNQSVLPISFLLSPVTSLVRWSPDLSAYGMVLQGHLRSNSVIPAELAADLAANWATDLGVLVVWAALAVLGFSWLEHRRCRL